MGNLNFSLILTAIDRATAPIRTVRAATAGLSGTTKLAVAPAKALSAASADLSRTMAPAAAATDRLGDETDQLAAAARRADRPLGRLMQRMGEVGRSPGLGRLSAGVAALGRLTGIGGLVGGAVGAVGGMGFFNLAKGILAAGSELEGYRTLLQQFEGDQGSVKKSLAWINDFAKKTPNEITEVMRAFIALRNAGMDPMDGTLKTLGDTAAVYASMGKSLDDVVQALGDARNGEFERLKEFGVTASQQGNKVKLIYHKNNKEIVLETRKSAADIQRAVRSIFDDLYSGAMQRQAGTMAGMISMLRDAWWNFQTDVANAGFFDAVKGELQTLLNWINKASADGTLTKWAKSLSEGLTKALKGLSEFASSIDWEGLVMFVGQLASGLAAIGRALGWVTKRDAEVKALTDRFGALGDVIRAGPFAGPRLRLEDVEWRLQAASGPDCGS